MGDWGYNGYNPTFPKREVLLPVALLGFLCVGVSQFFGFR